MVAPIPNIQLLRTVIGSGQANRSMPSSALSQLRQPSKTLPAPWPSLAHKPSALAPWQAVSSFWCESQFKTVLNEPLVAIPDPERMLMPQSPLLCTSRSWTTSCEPWMLIPQPLLFLISRPWIL